MALFVDIVQPLSLPGGLSATAVVNAPTVIISQNVVVTPTALAIESSLGLPKVVIDATFTATALAATATINAPTTAIIEPGLVRPPVQQVTASVNAPALSASSTFIASALSTTANVNAPNVLVGKIVTPATLTLTTSVNDPLVLTDRLILPPTFELTAVVNQPTLSGDLLFSVTDPPWNVIGIQLIINIDYADVQREDLPSMVGTLLYTWHNGIYNGKQFNWTGGQIVDTLDGNTVDPDQIFNVLYTVVQQNQGTSLGSDIIVLNLDEDFEVDCQDTDMDETSELLAALLGRQGIKRLVGSELCGSVELTTRLCGSIGYE